MPEPQQPGQNPKTPGFPPEQIAAVTMGTLGVVSQFLPLTAEAKDGVVQVVTIIAPTIAIAGAAVRVGRQKWWQNFWRVDADDNPATPSQLIPIPFLVALGVAVLLAIGFAIALIVVLV